MFNTTIGHWKSHITLYVLQHTPAYPILSGTEVRWIHEWLDKPLMFKIHLWSVTVYEHFLSSFVTRNNFHCLHALKLVICQVFNVCYCTFPCPEVRPILLSHPFPKEKWIFFSMRKTFSFHRHHFQRINWKWSAG